MGADLQGLADIGRALEAGAAHRRDQLGESWKSVQRSIRNAASKLIRGVVDYRSVSGDISDDEAIRNAVDHAAASAIIAQKTSTGFSKLLGDLKENTGALTNVIYTPEDTWKDQWNNAVGRKIAEYVKKEGMPSESVGALIRDALDNKQLIIHESDARIQLAFDPVPTWDAPSPTWLATRLEPKTVAAAH